MASRPVSVTKTLDEFTVDEVILWLNAHGFDDLYVCYECGELKRGDPHELCTTQYGDQQTFCTDCIIYCIGCEYEYAPPMKWMHEDCDQNDG